MPERSYTALDGSTVTLKVGRDEHHWSHWTSACLVNWAGRGEHEFLAGHLNFPRAFAEVLGVGLDEHHERPPLTVEVGSVEQYDDLDVYIGYLTVAAVKARRYACYAHMYNEGSERLLELVDSLSFSESPSGLTVKPATPRVSIQRPETTVNQTIDGLGVLEVRPLTVDRLRNLPAHPGTATANGGELYLMNRDTQSEHYMLLDATAVTTVAPLGSRADPDYLATLLGASASWTR